MGWCQTSPRTCQKIVAFRQTRFGNVPGCPTADTLSSCLGLAEKIAAFRLTRLFDPFIRPVYSTRLFDPFIPFILTRLFSRQERYAIAGGYLQ